MGCRVDMALACGSSHINPGVQALALGQSINLDSALSFRLLLLKWVSTKFVQIMPLGAKMAPCRETCKISCLKPLGTEPWYLVGSITFRTPNKFVQVMTLGQKRPRPRSHPFHCKIGLLCLIWFFTSQSIFFSCGGSSCVEPITSNDLMCLALGHNTVTPVMLEPATPRSQVKHYTTEPLHCPLAYCEKK